MTKQNIKSFIITLKFDNYQKGLKQCYANKFRRELVLQFLLSKGKSKSDRKKVRLTTKVMTSIICKTTTTKN